MLERPPMSNLVAEHPEGDRWRLLDLDRFADGHGCPPEGVAQNSSSRICTHLILAQNEIPSPIVVFSGLAKVFGLFPAAMLEFDACAAPLGGESNLYLGRPVPTGRAPGETDQRRRLKGGDSADFVFRTIGITLEEAAPNSPFNDHVGQEPAIK